MANETTATSITHVIPEVWRTLMLDARYESMKVAPRVLNVTKEVSSYGDIVHIPIEDTLTVNDANTSDGTLTNQTYDTTEAQLTVR